MTEYLAPPTGHDGTEQGDAELRQRAVKRLEDKRGLAAHALAYVCVNLLLVAIWFVTGAALLLAGVPDLRVGHRAGLPRLGRAVARRRASEAIQAEMERLRHRQA